MLRAYGAEVVEIPMTVTVNAADGGGALTVALAQRELYDWVVVTSPEGARRVRAGLNDVQSGNLQSGDTNSETRRPLFAAVGQATAVALGGADLVPTVQTGAGLGEEFPDGPGRVLLAVARDAGTDFEQAARAKGWTVDRVISYATEPVQHSLDSVMRDSITSSDAVTFTASSAVRAWVSAFGLALPPLVVAMGPQTAATLSAAGVSDFVIAQDQSLEGLVSAVVSALIG
jgi:uroporphyrinogen-III synthase